MEEFEGLCFTPVTVDDVEPLTGIMTRAFDEDGFRHLGRAGGPPGYNNGEFIRHWYLNAGSKAFKVERDGRVIGAVNVFLGPEGEGFLGNLMVDADLQDGGVGLKIWRFVEHRFPGVQVWRTETPGFSRRNHHFYVNKCGFHVIRIDQPKDLEEMSYFMEKHLTTSH